jgi:tetratricopeptide (TPR) repeat protein
MYKNTIVSLLIAASLSIVNFALAQDPETNLIMKYAENSFENGDYEFALENYLKLYENNKSDININFRIGVCYTETEENKTGGIPYLEFVISHNNFPTDAFYYLGRSYMFAYRFTEAVEALYEYKISGLNDKLVAEADHLITTSYGALEFVNQPAKVDFIHLDSSINTAMNDFTPFVTPDGEKLIFASNSRYVDELEMNVSDIYVSNKKGDGWEVAEYYEGNTYDHQEVAGMSADGENLFIYSNGDFATHDISMARIKKRDLTKVDKGFPATKINTKDFEHGATMSADGNTIIFSSNKPGGFGGFDLYYMTKDEDDNWSEPENLGGVINTPYDENFPTFAKESKNIYFSSNGHAVAGGFDIVQGVYDDNKEEYAQIRPLLMPINTPYDEMSISWVKDGIEGYIATNRKEGFGKLDIYKIVVNPDANNNILSGTIMVGDASASVPYSDDFNKLFITLYDKFGNIYARYGVEGNAFFASVPPGEYKLEIFIDGSSEKFTEELLIIDSGQQDFIEEIYYVKQ